ncbi:MAG: hypothetical protein JSV17_07840 [Candidatus Aminicenantes bacterium]|nr:MAG: hypothetical protein JSV17_07840 [Candidatus Aminicenantes bacterium]
MKKEARVYAVMIIFLTLLFSSYGCAKEIDKEKLIADARQLADILEKAHPDPYIRGGGKIVFHRRLQKTILSIPEEGMSNLEFYRLLRPFVAAVNDPHTHLRSPYPHLAALARGLPLRFAIVEQSLYVTGVPKEECRDLLGARLVAVEGVPFEEIKTRQQKLQGHDNEYDVLSTIGGYGALWYWFYLEQLIPEWLDKNQIRLVLLHPDGQERKHTLPTLKRVQFPLLGFKSEFDLPSREKCDFVYSFLDNEKRTALLLIDNMSTYKEAFEAWDSYGFPWTMDRAKQVFKRYQGKNPPKDKDALFAGLPSVTETFRSLVKDMKEAGTETLMIDLRRNQGGNSLMSQILVYYLYGKEELLGNRREKATEIRKLSEYFFKQYGKTILEELNEGSPVPLTREDYNLQHDREFQSERSDEDVAKEMEEFLERGPTFAEEYRAGHYSGYYLPKNVLVLSSANTFSSGWTLMYRLYKAGAILVGTPSSQAGNCFGDTLQFQLDNSKLSGSVSHKYFDMFPDDPEMGRVLRMHHQMTYDKLKSYDFDPNAEILFALEVIE